MPETNSGPARALILFGPPGSGKGTQANLIKECLGIPHISTGEMLREMTKRKDDLGDVVQRLLEVGELVTDDLVNRIVQERIVAPDCKGGFILDGYPRTLSQAGAICRRLAERGMGLLVVHLKVDYNIIIARLAGRKNCPKCGAVYNVVFHPPKTRNECDVCSTELEIREDDSETVVRRRLESYEAQTQPLLEFFSGDGCPIHVVDGASEAPAMIAQRICEAVKVG